MEYSMGGLAACGACLVTNPLDVIKTRLQLQGELQSRGKHAILYRNPLHAFYVVAKNDGLRGLQKGLVPALWYQFAMNGTRLGMFHYIEDRRWLQDQNGDRSPLRSIVAGAISGAFGAFVASPFYMIKTHLQSQSTKSIAVGYQHEHKGFLSAFRSLRNKSGVTGLWRGASASVLRVTIGSAAQLSTFTQSRDYIDHLGVFPTPSWQSALAASMLSGIAVVVCMTPMDVVSTRLYNQGVDHHGRGLTYKGPIDCLVKMFRTEGLMGFYKGCLANYLRIGPHTVLTLVMWTRLREMQTYLGPN